MKIVHLTSIHPRYDARVFLKECRSLAAAGHDMTLIVADGRGDEIRDGVHIVDMGKPSGRFRRMLSTVNQIYKMAATLEADVYHLHDPELLRVAGKLKRIGKGKLVIFDAHEDLPRQILSKQWIPSFLRRIVSFAAEHIEDYVTQGLSGVITATPHIAKRFRLLNSHAVDINNYPLPDELAPIGVASRRKRQVCYVGGINRARGIESLIRALPLVPDVVLVLCGNFQQSEFEAEMRALPGWDQVDYRGYVDRAEISHVLGESAAGMVTLLPTPAYLDSLPVKMFEYMAAELPVIASDFPLWRGIIDDTKAGICVNPGSSQAIANAILTVVNCPVTIDRMGKSGRKAVLEKYNWPAEAKKLVEFYEELQ